MGRSLSSAINSNDYEIHVISPHLPDPKDDLIIYHQGSLDNKALLEETIPICDTIIHLASTTTPGDSATDPTIEVDQNISPTIKFLDYLSSYKNKNLIFISSGGAIYNSFLDCPIKESHPFYPLSFYGAAKLSLEFFLQTFSNKYNFNLKILRPSNLYGPGQPLREGFGLIRTILQNLKDDKTMEIWGDGEIVRDYIYIEDMINAILTFIKYPSLNGIFNISSNSGYNINQVIHIIENVCDKKLKYKYTKQRKIDIKSVILDNTKIQSKCDWKAKTNLETGIRNTWNWLIKEKK